MIRSLSELKRIVDILKDFGVSGKYLDFPFHNQWWGNIANYEIVVHDNSISIEIIVNTEGQGRGRPGIYNHKFEIGGEFTEKHAEDILSIIFEKII